MIQAAITALIGGAVGLLFWRIEKKIDRLEKENDEHHKEQVATRKAEQDLLMAMADTITLTGRKVEDAASVNGELKESIKKTQEKKEAMQELTRAVALEHTV